MQLKTDSEKIICAKKINSNTVIGFIVCVCLPIVCLIASIRNNINASEIIEVTNRLDHCYIFKHASRNGIRYTPIIVLMDGSRYWTTAVDKDAACEVLKQQGANIRLYSNPNSTMPRLDGAIKSYGLWVNGQQISSLDSDLHSERLDLIVVSIVCIIGGGIMLIKNGSILKKSGKV